MTTLRLPARQHTASTTLADPLRFYYLPVARRFYRARLRDAASLLGDGHDAVLDFGTGSGIFLPELAARCRRLYACDVHDRLDAVREMARRESIAVTVLRSREGEIPMPNRSLDTIVAMSVLEHVRNPAAYVREMARVLRPGGRLIVGLPVDGPLTTLLLRFGYLLLPGARLEEEHIGGDGAVLAAFGKTLATVAALRLPRRGPRFSQLYTCVHYRLPR